MTYLTPDALAFQRDGFVLVRNVFSPDEVVKLRAAGEKAAKDAAALGHVLKSQTGEVVPVGDLLSREGLADVVLDERLLAIARKLLGKDDLVYFGDSGLMVGGHGRGFHKDNTCRDDASHPDWQTPYTLLRMGIYLEDHASFSGGLKVRRGSHLHADVTTGAIVDVPTMPGDVVVWSLRTTHSGHALRVRALPWLHLQPRFEVRLPQPFRIEEPCERVALFLTYGLDDAHLARFIEKHTNLDAYPDNYLYKSWLYSARDPSHEATGRARRVVVRRPIPDYGAKFGSSERAPLGYVPVGASTPDVYEARGAEAVIRAIGRATRAVTRATRLNGALSAPSE